MAGDASPKDGWDKTSAIAGIIAAVLVPIVVAVVGDRYSDALKARQASIDEATAKREWVKIGWSIFQDASTSPDMKLWAYNVINTYSEIKLPETTKDIFVVKAEPPPMLPSPGGATGAVPSKGENAAVTTTERVAQISKLQTSGMQALLNRNLDDAIAAYSKAYDVWPTFRNVDEILAYLKKMPTNPSNQQWQQAYQTLIRFDLRGVDAKVLENLHKAAG